MTEVKLDPRQVARVFLGIVATLVFLNCLLLGLNYYRDDDSLAGLLEFFDLDIEGNIPTLYSAVAVFICAGLLALIARIQWNRPGGQRGYWLALAIIFLFLGLDEGTAIHEGLSDWLEEYLPAEGALYFLWVVPYGFATAVIGGLYLRFLARLPKPTRLRFLGAAFVFLAGALGFEMLGGMAAEESGYDSVSYTLLYTIEETLEMLGIVWFLYALLRYIEEDAGGLVLRIGRG